MAWITRQKKQAMGDLSPVLKIDFYFSLSFSKALIH